VSKEAPFFNYKVVA